MAVQPSTILSVLNFTAIHTLHQPSLVSCSVHMKPKNILQIVDIFLTLISIQQTMKHTPAVKIYYVHKYQAQGASQGSPLSPLLSNTMLHGLYNKLHCRGHIYFRYADDCNIYDTFCISTPIQEHPVYTQRSIHQCTVIQSENTHVPAHYAMHTQTSCNKHGNWFQGPSHYHPNSMCGLQQALTRSVFYFTVPL